MITEHFSESELGVVGCEDRIVNNAFHLCREILEPIRSHIGPLHVTCGYRDPAHNERVGGKPDSFHLFEDGKAASDIFVPGGNRSLFEWIYRQSNLPYDKVILEYHNGSPACIHIQVDRNNPPRRLAYTGSTGAANDYKLVEA